MSDDEFEIKVYLGALLEHTLSPHPVRRMKKGCPTEVLPETQSFYSTEIWRMKAGCVREDRIPTHSPGVLPLRG